MHSDSESSHESLSDDEVSLSTQTHTALALEQFTKHAIQRYSKPLAHMKKVPNKLQPEPTIQYGARVMCHIDSKWQRIGYVVHECLEHVHKALSLDWVKYLVVLVLFWTWLLHWHTCATERRVASWCDLTSEHKLIIFYMCMFSPVHLSHIVGNCWMP